MVRSPMASSRTPIEDEDPHKDNRIICPCQDFAALSKIVDVLSSEDRTLSIIEWLNGDTDQIAIAEQRLLSCGKRFQCRYRYGTSFAILDAIQDATAIFLQEFPSSGSTLETPVKAERPQRQSTSQQYSPLLNYDTAFPPLLSNKPHPAASNILVPPKTTDKVITSTLENDSSRDHFTASLSFLNQSTTATTINTLPTRKKKSKVRIQPLKVTTSPDPSPGFDFSEQPFKPKNNSVAGTSTLNHEDTRHLSPQKPSVSTPTTTPDKADLDTERNDFLKLERLVEIYIALIRNMLVPSTPAQLQLLLQLLFVDSTPGQNQTPSSSTSDGHIQFFSAIFSSPAQCVAFARTALLKLQQLRILLRLGPPIVHALVQIEAFQRLCPTVAQELKIDLKKINAERETQHFDSITPHAIFSLPFDHDRDSRHNYKTQSEVALYKNREESRDAFLSQLRTFMTATSRAFVSQEVEKIRETAQHESRRIIRNLFTINMIWFAQFFCDLLLQVGLSPVEEMDQDLLSFVKNDKERLQRLHSRMHGKGVNTHGNRRVAARGMSRSKQNVVFGETRNIHHAHTKNQSSTSTPFVEALQEFPGYQEFFFLFLNAADSYMFGIHLSRQLAKKIKDAIGSRSTIGLEKRMMDLQLLGRFLGYLVYSPQWHEQMIDWSKLKPLAVSPNQSLKQLESVGIDLLDMVYDAWVGRYTLLVIPFVSEVLKMSRWDSLTQTSRLHRQLLANLRWMQRTILEPLPSNDNLQIVYTHLENLFHFTVTLPRLTSLPSPTIFGKAPNGISPRFLDSQRICFSSVATNANSAPMESLSEMILEGFAQVIPHDKTRIVKKLRPLMVSTPGTQMKSYIGIESPTAKMLTDNQSSHTAEVTPDEKRSEARRRLEDAFFHQHRTLKETCDFVTDQTLKAITADEIKDLVSPAASKSNEEGGLLEVSDEAIYEKGMEMSRQWMKQRLKTRLTATLEVLTKPKVDAKVIEIAVQLCLQRGMRSAEMILSGTVTDLVRTVNQPSKRTHSAQRQHPPAIGLDIDKAVTDATSSINGLGANFSTTDASENLSSTMNALRLVTIVKDSMLIPSDESLRGFFTACATLDEVADQAIKMVLDCASESCWATFLYFLRLTAAISQVSVYGAKRAMAKFGSDFGAFHSACEIAQDHDTRMELLQKLLSPTEIATREEHWISADSESIEPRKIQFH